MAGRPADDLEAALASVEPERRDAVRALAEDASYVEPRVVTHLAD